jgi:hypothetical protein
MLCFSFSHSRHDAVEPEGAQGSDSMARELEGGAGSTRSDASPAPGREPKLQRGRGHGGGSSGEGRPAALAGARSPCSDGRGGSRGGWCPPPRGACSREGRMERRGGGAARSPARMEGWGGEGRETHYVKISNRSREICNGPLTPVTSTHICNGCCLAPVTYKRARATPGLASTTPVTNVDFW